MKVAPFRECLFLLQAVWACLEPGSRLEVLWTVRSRKSAGEVVFFWLTLGPSCVAFGLLFPQTLCGTQPLMLGPLSTSRCDKGSWRCQDWQVSSGQRWPLRSCVSRLLVSLWLRPGVSMLSCHCPVAFDIFEGSRPAFSVFFKGRVGVSSSPRSGTTEKFFISLRVESLDLDLLSPVVAASHRWL